MKSLAGWQITLKIPSSSPHLLADQKLFTPRTWIATNPKQPMPYFEFCLPTLSWACWCENKLNMAPDLSVITRRVFQSLKTSCLWSPGREHFSLCTSGGKRRKADAACTPPKVKKFKISVGDSEDKRERSYFPVWWDNLLETEEKGLDPAVSFVVSIPVAKSGHLLTKCFNHLRKKKYVFQYRPEERSSSFSNKKNK